ncbi:MAG: SRPBCC family protein, partial [Myxococcales bacterium]|nr:SRPBCC family protein [Myxococcales bacterium]
MEMRRTIEMEASADQAWQVLGERFGDIAQWSSTLATSSLQGTLGVGATRVCQGTGFGPFPPGEVTEELVEFDR